MTIKDPPIDVAKLDAVYPEATGEYEYFSLISGDLTEELVEGFGAGLNYVNLSRVETRRALIRTREELTRAVDSMSKLIDEFIKARRKRGD